MKNSKDYDLTNGNWEDLWTNEEKRFKFFSSVIPKIDEKIKKLSIVSKLFEETEIEAGQIINHDNPKRKPAFYITSSGESIDFTTGNRVYPPLYDEGVSTKISLSDIILRQYNIIQKTIDKTALHFAILETIKLKQLVEASVKWYKNKKRIRLTHKKKTLFKLEKLINQQKREKDITFLVCTENVKDKLQDLIKNFGTEEQIKNISKFFGLEFLTVFDKDPFFDIVKNPLSDTIYLFPQKKVGYKYSQIPITMFPADMFILGKLAYGIMYAKIESMTLMDTDSIFKIKI